MLVARGGEMVHVQGLDIHLPKKPEKKLIANWDLPKKEQKWRRSTLPDDWNERRAEEIRKQDENAKYVDPTLEAFRVQEWTRRLNGYWFFNNGKATYITGPNYYYINWCKFDHPENGGYPTYFDFTRSLFYFRDYCVELQRCLGYLVIGPRGTGKSSEEVACILESMTRPPGRRQAAIQSKSEDDAKQKIFKEKMVEVYKALPDFFQPISNHGSNPESKLSFFKNTVRGKKAKNMKMSAEEELANVIYPVPAKEKALDGGTFSEILNDEIGKTDPKREANVYDRQNVNRFCVFRNNRKRGMIRATTTVEEMDKGGLECHKVWKESDQLKLTKNGFTISGLFRFFISAIDACNQFADEYGYIDRAKAKEYHDIERDARKHDPVAYSSYIRKNPYTTGEAFMVDGDRCVFNAMILNDRWALLDQHDKIAQRGDFIWKDDEQDGKVIFVPNSRNGKFYVAWLPGKDEDTNKVIQIRSIVLDGRTIKCFKPNNDEKFAIATDPVDHGQTVDGRKSKAAAYVFRKYDMLIDPPDKVDEEGRLKWETHNFVTEYITRPLEPEVYYEDMIKICKFYGCKILVENQKQGIIHYFKHRGYFGFIMNRPENTFTSKGSLQDTPGIPASRPMIQQYTNKLMTHIQNHGHRLKFKRLVVDLLEFDPNKPTKYDASVAAGFTLIASEKTMPKQTQSTGGAQYFQTFDNTGAVSKLNT